MDKGQFAVKGYFDTRLPGQSYFGAEPDALAVSRGWAAAVCGEHGVGCGGGDRYDEADGEGGEAGDGGADRIYADGVDADGDERWLDGKLYVATAKGKGTGPNNFRAAAAAGDAAAWQGELRRISRRCCMGRWRRWM